MCDRLEIIYEYFAYIYTLYASVHSETGHRCIRFFLPSKQLCMLVYSQLLYLMCASAGLTSWMTLGFRSYVNLQVLYIFYKFPTSLWSLVNVQHFLDHLYTCPVQPCFYDNNSSSSRTWLELSRNPPLTIISCEPLLYRYT